MKTLLALLLLLLTLFCAGPVLGADSPLWGNLKGGPHAVGFTARLQHDYSRTFRSKYDDEGKLIANRARPIQITIWYPAQKSSAPNFMTYKEYAYMLAQELNFDALTEQSKQSALRQFQSQRKNFSGASEQALQKLLNSQTAAVRDMAPQNGKFPMIVYAPGASGTAVENPVLCEYLASHGYIVASLPSLGAYSREAQVDLTGFYAYMQDIEYVIGYMHDFPNVDPDRLGLIGFSMGGSAATLVQMRNFDVDAAVYLDTGIIFDVVQQWFRPSNYYNPLDLRAPQLYLTRNDADGINVNFIDAIPYADTYSMLFEEGYRHVDFIADGVFSGVIPGYLPAKAKNPQTLFETVSRYTLQFVDAYVRDDPEAQQLLSVKPDPKLASLEIRKAETAPPREFEFVRMLRDGKLERARQILRQAKQNNARQSIFREQTVNVLGYEFLFRGDPQRSIEIFQLNIEAFPQSANAHDSLSEAYDAAGKRDLALTHAQKGLELIATDTTMDEPRKGRVKQALEDRLKKLKS